MPDLRLVLGALLQVQGALSEHPSLENWWMNADIR